MKTFRSQKSEVRSQIFLFSVICFLFSALSGCQKQRLYKDNRVMMGTFIEVTSPDKRAARIAFKEMQRIEGLLSKYRPASEISRLNRLGSLKVSADTLYVIKKAQEFWGLSQGSFDITVGPLMDLWGFTDKNFRVPEEPQVRAALKLVGANKIIVNEAENMIKFSLSGMKVDLGGIAKGYALDCAVKKLRHAGVKSCLINAGGQVRCLGYKFFQPWVIAVRNPRGRGLDEYLMLAPGRSAATSGDYEQFFFEGKRRYAHILNPKTGFPAQSGIAAVTVIAPDGLTADALSTAIFILGQDKGRELIKNFPTVEARITREPEEDVADRQ